MTREEAIDVYNGLINTKIKEAFEFFAPELREPEDEKIRRDIVAVVEMNEDLTQGRKSEIYAYLEKQKEQPISAEEVLARAGLKPYKDGNQWCILAGDNIQEGICGFGDTIDEALYQFLMEVFEMQKEQKPAEKSSMLKILKEHLANTPREQLDAEFEALKDLTIDKPTWSEEDERIRKLLIWQVHRNIEDETNDLAQSVYDGIKGHDPDLEESIEDWKKCLAWLKSLPLRCPKSSDNWKPSEEQIRILNWAANGMVDQCIAAPEMRAVLRDLYEQLKNL